MAGTRPTSRCRSATVPASPFCESAVGNELADAPVNKGILGQVGKMRRFLVLLVRYVLSRSCTRNRSVLVNRQDGEWNNPVAGQSGLVLRHRWLAEPFHF